MSNRYRTLTHWKETLERSAREAVGGRVDGPDRDSYQICAAVCRLHGSDCALVVYGALLTHCDWEQEDPHLLARQLAQTMLPPETPQRRSR
jgi:hypothetical protein